MRHGYTNVTTRVGATVTKTYVGPQALERAERERLALRRLAGMLPVPLVIHAGDEVLVAEFIEGRHGQDLLQDGHAPDVLAGCGRVLRQLHSIPPTVVFDKAGDGVIVHGDFGPNNVLFASDRFEVSAVLDWEFCHVGDPIGDLAWCEWIVRAHHPDATFALPSFFEAYGWTPPWSERQRVMVQRCAALERFCRKWDAEGDGVRLWARRAEQARAWRE